MTDSAPINPEDLRPAIASLLQKAKRAGADKADALATHGRSLGVVSRGGELEDVDNSEGRDIGLRVMIGQKQACVSSSDFSESSLSMLAERAVAMAKLAPDDPYCGLADADQLETQAPDLDLFDDTAFEPQSLLTKAQTLEKTILSVDGVQQAEGSNMNWSTSGLYFMTSEGFEGGWRGSHFGLSGMAIAARDGAMERDYDMANARYYEDLDDIETIGKTAGERAVARLGSRQLESGALPVMFDQRLSRVLVSAFIGAISGTAIARGTSFLKDKMGEQVFADHINLIDDPSIPRGHASHPWDGEGAKVKRQALIENGVLKTWLLNSSTARQLGLKPTGHASRGISSPPRISASNTYIEAGNKTPAELLEDVGEGLLITDMFGPSLNSNTGDYSVGVAGFKVENGERAFPVSEITIAGNLLNMFKQMTPANDLVFDDATSAPSLLIEGMTIAGT